MALDRPLSILQITDLHLFLTPEQKMEGVNTERSFYQVLDDAHRQQGEFDLILVTGDLTQDASQAGYKRIYQLLKKYPSKVICLSGNHDEPALMQQIIAGERINCNKSIQFDHWQIINLNSQKQGSEGGRLAVEELELLAQLIEENATLNTLVAVHHHLIPTKSAWLDTMIIENRDEFFSTVEKYPQVKAVICGHIHQELEVTTNNILMLGTPATCFQFKPNCVKYTLDDKKPGYRILQLFPGGELKTKVYHLSSLRNV
jgi:Icc protein